MKYALFYEAAPDFRAKVPAHMAAHRALWKRYQDQGTLLMVGPFTDEPSGGAMGIFTTRAAAGEFAAEDPFVMNGVVARWSIREWAEALTQDTRAVVEGYFTAWTTQKIGEARALLADDLKFSGPSASYDSAEAFQPALVKFAAMTIGARIVELIVDGDRAALLYDCELVPPIGTLRIAAFFSVKAGKICAYDTRFDAGRLSRG